MDKAVYHSCPETHAGNIDSEGIFISFEGGEGAGKTTHIRFLARCIEQRGKEVLCLREPGGTEIGERLREMVLDAGNAALSDTCELFLFEAARAQLVHEVIEPALKRGAVVLCDRFTDSSLAYQGFGRGLDKRFIASANDFACVGIVPHRTIVMSSGGSVSEGLERATHRAGADRIELSGLDFHARVNAAFFELAKADPARVRVVLSSGKKSETSRAVFTELHDLFPWMDEALSTPGFFDSLDAPRSD